MKGNEMLDMIDDQASLPPWLNPDHFQAYVSAFSQGGFKGPFDWYRNIDRNWATTEAVQDHKVTVPALFMVGEHDPTRHYTGTQEAEMADWVPDLRSHVVVPGAGHWLQQERPETVNEALLGFLKDL